MPRRGDLCSRVLWRPLETEEAMRPAGPRSRMAPSPCASTNAACRIAELARVRVVDAGLGGDASLPTTAPRWRSSMSRFWMATVLVLGFLAGVARAEDDDLTLLLERGQLRRAEGVARKRLEAHPDDAVALSALARVR